jgi:glycosyltransferase involved in cell wall biosynthesis
VRTAVDLSVVVPTYGRSAAVRQLLDCLSLQTLAPIRFEVVVSIDGSRDGTRQVVAGYDAPFLLSSIWQERRGRASACNAGIRRATAPLVLLLDDDMEPMPECLEAHVDAHAGGRRHCVLGAAPIELQPGDAPIAHYFGLKFQAHLARLAEPNHHFVARDFYSGNLSCSRRLLLEVGLFDPSFTRYGNEDIDLALRLRAAGAQFVYEPRAVARQRFDKDLARAIADALEKGQTANLVARKHPDALSELRLGTYAHAGPRWRLLRRALLSFRWSSPILTRLTLLLERCGIALPWRYYDHLLDFFFWLGAEQTGDDLAPDDEASPADLLLHR